MAEPWAVLAEFADAPALLDAVRRLRRRGFAIETFTPFPLDELETAIGFTGTAVPKAFLIGGIAGAAVGFGMPAWLSFAFPLWIGGRPVVAVPAFLMIAFELMVLGAVVSGVLTMLLANRLPRLHHPVFDAERFTLAEERFFVAVLAGPEFDRDEAGKALAALDPLAITDLEAQPA